MIMEKTRADVLDQQFLTKTDIRILFPSKSKSGKLRKMNANDANVIFAKASDLDREYFEKVYGVGNSRPRSRQVTLGAVLKASNTTYDFLKKQIKNG